MILKTIVPKIGNIKEYLDKPFIDENGKQIGSVVDCIDNGSTFELIIKAELQIDMQSKTSMSIKTKFERKMKNE